MFHNGKIYHNFVNIIPEQLHLTTHIRPCRISMETTSHLLWLFPFTDTNHCCLHFCLTLLLHAVKRKKADLEINVSPTYPQINPQALFFCRWWEQLFIKSSNSDTQWSVTNYISKQCLGSEVHSVFRCNWIAHSCCLKWIPHPRFSLWLTIIMIF